MERILVKKFDYADDGLLDLGIKGWKKDQKIDYVIGDFYVCFVFINIKLLLFLITLTYILWDVSVL